ncbi:MAG TPA: choice-of-anchor tandem repeat GloVer-containing protein [Rhizomicrobium sp.]
MKATLPSIAVLALAVASAASVACASGYTDENLHDFCSRANCTDGRYPSAALVRDASGELFGTADRGGQANSGVVFELVPDAGSYKFYVIHNFGDGDGLANPDGGHILEKNGRLYGTASGGGTNNRGAVFRLSYAGAGWTLAVLHNFGGADGEVPEAGLAYAGQSSGRQWDESSPLFGTANAGGIYGNGVAYELAHSGSTWTETVIHNFKDSRDPDGLLEDAAGNLWGANSDGGKYGGGLMYRLARGTWKQTVVHNFCEAQNCSDGSAPGGVCTWTLPETCSVQPSLADPAAQVSPVAGLSSNAPPAVRTKCYTIFARASTAATVHRRMRA